VSRRDDERVADILDAAGEIAAVIELGRDAWDKDRIRQLAVERLLEIIGEAANSLSADFRAQHPGIPWRDIIGLRVVLAHHYHRVDPGYVTAWGSSYRLASPFWRGRWEPMLLRPPASWRTAGVRNFPAACGAAGLPLSVTGPPAASPDENHHD
jgi:uncharacterized protein with HEPN domain